MTEADRVLADILMLVEVNVLPKQVAKWTAAQKASAEKWASLLHLRASDNPVRVPKMPKHLNKHYNKEL